MDSLKLVFGTRPIRKEDKEKVDHHEEERGQRKKRVYDFSDTNKEINISINNSESADNLDSKTINENQFDFNLTSKHLEPAKTIINYCQPEYFTKESKVPLMKQTISSLPVQPFLIQKDDSQAQIRPRKFINEELIQNQAPINNPTFVKYSWEKPLRNQPQYYSYPLNLQTSMNPPITHHQIFAIPEELTQSYSHPSLHVNNYAIDYKKCQGEGQHLIPRHYEPHVLHSSEKDFEILPKNPLIKYPIQNYENTKQEFQLPMSRNPIPDKSFITYFS